MYDRSKGICKNCGEHHEIESCEVHHVHPIIYGGQPEIENLVLLCVPCHHIETAALFASLGLDRAFEAKHRKIISDVFSSAYLPAISLAAYRIVAHEIREMVEASTGTPTPAPPAPREYRDHLLGECIGEICGGPAGQTDEEFFVWAGQQMEKEMAGEKSDAAWIDLGNGMRMLTVPNGQGSFDDQLQDALDELNLRRSKRKVTV